MPPAPSAAARPTSGRIAGALVLGLLLGLIAWSVATLQPPSPAARTAAPDRFSAARATGQIQRIAVEPHVVGSAADDRVVDTLVSTLSGLGLDTRVQTTVGEWPDGRGATEMASVRNVVAVLPGTHSTGRLFLMAHHDSVQNGPGGSDDSAGVATAIETVRALLAGPRPRNDVVVVITDGEEACLCGAAAFADAHPLAGSGGVVLNLEARGTDGPPIMFETSTGNAALATEYAAAVPHPVATSFAVEVYRALPNDTDFTPMLADGRFTGLNTAWIDGAAAYHTARDTAANVNTGSLQALGDNTLALARRLGNADLAALAHPAASDATYFPVLGRLVHYSGRLVWPLAVAALVAVVALALALRRRAGVSLLRTAGATALALLPLAVAPLAVQGLWLLLVKVRPEYGAMTDPWRPQWYRLAAVLLVVAVTLVWYALLRRRIGAATLALGALVLLAVLGAALAALAPGGSYLTALPALAGAAVGLVAVLVPTPAVRVAAALLGGAVAVVVLAPSVALFFPALGMRQVAATAFVATLLALALLPAFELLFPPVAGGGRVPARRWATAAVPLTVLVLAAAAGLVGLGTDRFSAAHPAPTQLAYAFDSDQGKAWWASTEVRPGPVTAQYVRGPGTLPGYWPYLSAVPLAVGPAQVAALPPPVVTPVTVRPAGDRREITVRVAPQRPVRLLDISLAATGERVLGARVNGQSVAASVLGGDRLAITFHGPPAGGLEVTFTVSGSGPVQLRAVDGSDGLTGLPGFRPRPADVQAAGSHSSDLVLVARTTQIG